VHYAYDSEASCRWNLERKASPDFRPAPRLAKTIQMNGLQASIIAPPRNSRVLSECWAEMVEE